MNTSFVLIFKLIFIDIIGDVFYFPIWWYTKGLWRVTRNRWQIVKNKEASLGVGLWIKNIFVPMFGQHDAAGRIISFIMRVVQIVARSTVLLATAIFEIFLLFLWIFLPIFVINEIFYHFKFFIY